MLDLPKRTTMLRFDAADLIWVLLRDGTLLEHKMGEQNFRNPEFGRSVSLTAVDGHLFGDRDGVMTLLGDRANRICEVKTVPGYIMRISKTLVTYEHGLFDFETGRVIFSGDKIQDAIQLSKGKRFFVDQFCTLWSIDTADTPVEIAHYDVSAAPAKLRADVPMVQLGTFGNETDFCVVDTLGGLVRNVKGKVIVGPNSFADVELKDVHDVFVVKVHFQGKMEVYE